MNIEELYRTIAPKLTNWLVSSGSSYHEACDLVQSAFLKIWKMRDDLQGDESDISGLAFTIARNLRKNLARDNARITFVGEIRDPDDGNSLDYGSRGYGEDDGEGDGGATSRVASSASMRYNEPEVPSDAEYLRKRLKEAFAKLPPVLREAYTLFQIGEMSVHEIANQTGVSENLVKVRIFRAKERLKKILSDLRVTY